MIRGLSTPEVNRRRKAYGPNALTEDTQLSVWQRIRALLMQPMFALLLAVALLYVGLGELEDGMALLLVVLAVLGLTYRQEQKSNEALQALREMAQPFVTVIRDGQLQKVAVHEIVVGDLLSLMEGQQVGADARLLESHYLEADESLLTGESASVAKHVGERVFAGTHVIRGEGLARVTGTGRHSTMGQIGVSLQRIGKTPSPLHRQTARWIHTLAKVVLVLCAVMWLVQGVLHGNWLNGFLAAIVLAMSLLPEEYAVVLSLFPALGAKRLASHGVLTTNIHAIETLGACAVVCTDKTGTLTQNLMKPEQVVVATAEGLVQTMIHAGGVPAPSTLDVLQVAVLASSPRPFDAMEISLREAVAVDTQAYGEIVHSYTITADLRVVAQAWRSPQAREDQSLFLAAKGAPEDVSRLCQLSPSQKALWMKQVDQMAEDGLRIIAVAKCEKAPARLLANLAVHRFEWLGLIGFRDPIREEIPDAMQACAQAGIRVVMITGDHPKTALAIARQSGMSVEDVVLGDALDALSPQALADCVRRQSVFARVSPMVKLKIVQTLKADGKVVAMIGDGVNDAIAMQAADVAVAMGKRGTDVARRTAALILLEDDFAALIAGIGHGRTIFTNMQKSMSYLLAVHIPIAGLAISPMLLNTAPLLLPLHMACLELVIDPACSVVFENEPAHANAMQVPPRNVKQSVLEREQIQKAVVRGLFALGMVLLCYMYAVGQTDDLALHRSMVFVTLVMGNIMLMTAYRQHQSRASAYGLSNPRMVWLSLGAAGLTLLLIYWPLASELFKFTPLAMNDFMVALLFGAMTGLSRYVAR